jgi:hypothetical protein
MKANARGSKERRCEMEGKKEKSNKGGRRERRC